MVFLNLELRKYRSLSSSSRIVASRYAQRTLQTLNKHPCLYHPDNNYHGLIQQGIEKGLIRFDEDRKKYLVVINSE